MYACCGHLMAMVLWLFSRGLFTAPMVHTTCSFEKERTQWLSNKGLYSFSQVPGARSMLASVSVQVYRPDLRLAKLFPCGLDSQLFG